MIDEFIGNSEEIRDILYKIEIVSKEDMPIIICGETGTGKEVLARMIHAKSSRNNNPFCAIQCASINESLAESELFGHEKGAFTGAVSHRKGKFEYASDGTLLLDDVDTLSQNIQAKILRAVEHQSFERIGGNESVSAKCRIISTTNKDLAGKINDGKFREDLYYRLSAFSISIPPLRERREDIAELAEYFVKKYCEQSYKTQPQFSQDAIDTIVNYNWPGNIRQLQNVMKQSVVFLNGDAVLTYEHFYPLLYKNGSPKKASSALKDSEPYQLFNAAAQENDGEVPDLHTLKALYIRDLMKLNDGNVSTVADILNISRSTLNRYIRNKEESVL